MKNLLILFVLILVACLFSGCSIAPKSWGIAASSDAFKITPSNLNSGNPTLEIVAGGGCMAAAFQKGRDPKEKAPTIFSYSRRRSMWGMFSGGLGATNVSIVYIAGTDETPEDTLKILKGFNKIINPKEPSK